MTLASSCNVKEYIAEKKHERQIKKAYKIATRDKLAFSKVAVDVLETIDSIRIITQTIKGKPDTTFIDTGMVIVIDCDSIRLLNKSQLVHIKCPPSKEVRITDTIRETKEITKRDRKYEIVLQGAIDQLQDEYDDLELSEQFTRIEKDFWKKRCKKIIRWLWIIGIGLLALIVGTLWLKKINPLSWIKGIIG